MTFFGPDLRNGLPIGLGSVAGFGIAPRFSPASLFAGGVQGAWYDPSDLTTLFQDSAGTTPVTAVEQPVGLMLDKSKGLVLGSEVVASPLAGTLGASYTIVGDTVVRSGSTGTAVLNIVGGNPVVQDRTYLVQFTASNVTGDSVAIRVGNGTAYGPFSGNGTFTIRAVSGAATTSAITFLPFGGGAATATYSNISVKAIPGNHAYQTTSASRPTLRARYNLLTYSEQFDNAAWTDAAPGSTVTVTANSSVAPDGTTTADTLTPNVGGTNAMARQVRTLTASTTYAGSLYIKAGTSTQSRILVRDTTAGTNFADASLNWSGGVPSVAGGATGTWSVTPSGNGWYRVVGVGTSGATASPVISFSVFPDSSVGTGTLLVWGAQLVPTAVFPSNTYQRIGAATDYATGAAFPPYLFFDGTDDSMLTNSVDFATVTSDGQARRNLLTNPTQFDAAGWTLVNCTISANATTAPDGTTTADKIVSAALTGAMRPQQTVTLTAATTYTVSAYFKAAEVSWVSFRIAEDGGPSVWFDVANGTLGTRESGWSASSITNVGGGWYRCQATLTTIGTSYTFRFVLASGNNDTTYVGNGVNGIFIWGAQLETGSTATAFQNIGTDKMLVVAGVTKQSDAAAGIVAELSANGDSNNGAFYVSAAAGAASNYATAMRGTSLGYYLPATFAAPITNVVSMIGDIAQSTLATEIVPRINGTVVQTGGVGGSGTGNFGNYPLYIGRRNNATLPFNGNLYSLIIAGQSYSSGQISSTESWVAAKTPLGTI